MGTSAAAYVSQVDSHCALLTTFSSMNQCSSASHPEPLAAHAGRLIDEMRSGADVETHPGELDIKQITRLHQLLHEAKFRDLDGSHLSPAGEFSLLLTRDSVIFHHALLSHCKACSCLPLH